MNAEPSVTIYRIVGNFRKRKEIGSFSKEICALTEEQAKRKLYSELGSRNRLKRHQIKIESIHIISLEEVTDPLVKKIITSDFKIPIEE
ncbi:MAG: 50S ribosomal protein L18a [Candidatus Heimdallarchaeota archaeon]|nr:50S ribosomal protein L18a [Candidatus Heimdallarchaeota archaeon]